MRLFIERDMAILLLEWAGTLLGWILIFLWHAACLLNLS